MAAIKEFRSSWWRYLTNKAHWFLPLGIAALAYGLYLGEDDLTIATCVWQFPLVAFGMATLLLAAVSPGLPLRCLDLPGAAFIASIAYSVYLSHKLVIHQVAGFCASHDIAPASGMAHLIVEVSIYLAGTLLFLAIERPCLRLRRRLVPSN
jgi:peptidoglycan/LPS O-acetylase OafA/YrhL